jgi:hypothetical protein
MTEVTADGEFRQGSGFVRCTADKKGQQYRASADLDEILVRQRSAGKLSELAADRERSKIDADEADLVDECRHFRLCCAVVAGIEQYAPSAVRPRIAGQDFGGEVIERLHDARAGQEIDDDLAPFS